MAPAGQRVFALVPTTLVSTTGSKPPMTSKAAKKAYAKANQGQRLSRAEQRRRDAEELERQKKEFEKEKAAKRAKAARERKQEKEEQARLERKKNGEPEKSKWVRASQPSISKFVRGEGGKRKWKDIDEESEDTLGEDDSINGERPAKRLAVVAEEEEASAADKDTLHSVFEDNGDQGSIEKNAESEDEFGDFPSFSQVGVLETLLSPVVSKDAGLVGYLRQESHDQSPGGIGIARHDPSQELPPHRKHFDDDILFGNTQDEADLASAQLQSEEAEAAAKSDPVDLVVVDGRCTMRQSKVSRPKDLSHLKGGDSRQKDDSSGTRKDLKETLSTLALKESSNFKIPSIPEPQKSNKALLRMVPNCAPPSTQAFLEDNIDDFMPSASQEARELQDDLDMEDLRKEVQVTENSIHEQPSKVVDARRSSMHDDFNEFICTQDLILSSQDILEISPVKLALPNPPKPPSQKVLPSPVFKKPYLPKPKSSKSVAESDNAKAKFTTVQSKQSPVKDAMLDDFPCTQDFALSPSDLEELLTPSKISVSTRTKNNLDAEVRRLLAQEPQYISDPKSPRKNTEYKLPQPPSIGLASISSKQHIKSLNRSITDASPKINQPQNRPPLVDITSKNALSHAPKHSSKSLTKQISHQSPTSTIEPAPQKPQPKPKSFTKQPKPRFFEEKETDLVEAAMHESKVMAERAQSIPPSRTHTPAPKHLRKKNENIVSTRRGQNSIVDHARKSNNILGKENQIVRPQGHSRSDVSGKGTCDVDNNARPMKQSRKPLQRAQSAATDYGDDEFDGLCEEDFEGLC